MNHVRRLIAAHFLKSYTVYKYKMWPDHRVEMPDKVDLETD